MAAWKLGLIFIVVVEVSGQIVVHPGASLLVMVGALVLATLIGFSRMVRYATKRRPTVPVPSHPPSESGSSGQTSQSLPGQ